MAGRNTSTSRAGDTGGKAFKAITVVGALTAATLARKMTSTTWKLATGNEPPANPEDPAVSWAEAVGFALLSGAAIGLARMLASRQAAAWWRRSTGQMPSNLQDASS